MFLQTEPCQTKGQLSSNPPYVAGHGPCGRSFRPDSSAAYGSVSLSFEFSKNLLFKSAQLPSNWVQRTPRFLPDIGWRCHQGCLWVYGGNTSIAWALNTQSRGKMGFVTLKLECSVSCSLPHGLLHTHSSLSLPPPRFSPPFLCIPELNLMKMHKKCFYSVKCNPSTHTSYILCRNESISAGKADKSI